MFGIGSLLSLLKVNWKIVAVVVLAGLIAWGVYSWKEDIRKAAFDTFFSDLQTQEIALLNAEISRLTELNRLEREANERLLQNRGDIDEYSDSISVSVANEEDGEVAPVLRKTLDQIK
jgi:tmRNA-binding protein